MGPTAPNITHRRFQQQVQALRPRLHPSSEGFDGLRSIQIALEEAVPNIKVVTHQAHADGLGLGGTLKPKPQPKLRRRRAPSME